MKLHVSTDRARIEVEPKELQDTDYLLARSCITILRRYRQLLQRNTFIVDTEDLPVFARHVDDWLKCDYIVRCCIVAFQHIIDIRDGNTPADVQKAYSEIDLGMKMFGKYIGQFNFR